MRFSRANIYDPDVWFVIDDAECKFINLHHLCRMVRGINRIGYPGTTGSFDIGVAVVMACEAVNIKRILEVETRTRIAVANMAFVAAILVAGDAYAKVVENISLADCSDALAGNVFEAFPIPVGRLHHFGVATIMAGDTCGSYLL